MSKIIFICVIYLITNSVNAQVSTSSFQQYSLARISSNEPNINYYLSKPLGAERYPIVILVGGSTDKEHLASILEFHRYFMKDISENNLGVISVEKWGINGDEVLDNTVMAHYTRTQILHDYQRVIDDIKKNPPSGWNGKMALLGVSEGGDILFQLNENNPNIVATVFWSGSDDISPRESLWLDMQQIYKSQPECHSKDCHDISTRAKYDARMDEILKKPSSDAYFFNMTHLYVADYLNFPRPDYKNFHGKILMVTGVKDTLIGSSDIFYKKAINNNVDVTYWRIKTMDHAIRYRPDLISDSFVWLREELEVFEYFFDMLSI